MFHMSQRYIGEGEQFRRNRGSNEETENPGGAAGERGEHGGGGERGGETREVGASPGRWRAKRVLVKTSADAKAVSNKTIHCP